MKASEEDLDYILSSFRESLSNLVEEEKAVSIDIEETRLDSSETDPIVVVLFRNREHPECLFGWSMEAIESVPEDEEPMDRDIWNTVLWANFMEIMFSDRVRSGQDCADGITWVY